MIRETTRSGIGSAILSAKKQGNSVGFVPTMGALHQGHLSLITKALEQTSRVVVSIFVNPTQFNNKQDLLKYPRNMTRDLNLLSHLLNEEDLVFTPDEKEMYPEPDTRIFDFGKLDKTMEGAQRPGHFNGVAQIVSKLFDYVKPDVAYFGQKDLQQLILIKRMCQILNLSVKIVDVPIIREPDGLAMSSRNERLGKNERKEAPKIFEALERACVLAKDHSILATIKETIDFVNKSPELKVEYFEIVSGSNLESINNWNEASEVYGCIAVMAGSVRLIDNIQIR